MGVTLIGPLFWYLFIKPHDYVVRFKTKLSPAEKSRLQAGKITKGLRAIYNGNYITSDRAWHVLLEYAEENKTSITKNYWKFSTPTRIWAVMN